MIPSSDPCGIRTQPCQCERLATSPEVERAVVGTYLSRQAAQESLESMSVMFMSAASSSQRPTYPSGPECKKARRLATPGPGGTRLRARCQVIRLRLPRRLPSRPEQSDCSGQQGQLRHSRHRHLYEANMISLSGMRLLATIVRSVSIRCCDIAKGSHARQDFLRTSGTEPECYRLPLAQR